MQLLRCDTHWSISLLTQSCAVWNACRRQKTHFSVAKINLRIPPKLKFELKLRGNKLIFCFVFVYCASNNIVQYCELTDILQFLSYGVFSRRSAACLLSCFAFFSPKLASSFRLQRPSRCAPPSSPWRASRDRLLTVKPDGESEEETTVAVFCVSDGTVTSLTRSISSNVTHSRLILRGDQRLVMMVLPLLSVCINPLSGKLNPICHLLALLGAHHFLHVSRVRVNLL